MSQTINDRIELLVNEHCDGNKAAFAKSIGYPPTGLSSYLGEKRRSLPSVKMLVKILERYNVDALWLLTGEKGRSNVIHIEGDYSSASHGGNASVVVGDAILKEKVSSLSALVKAQAAHINDLQTIIDRLTKNINNL